jgi:hypothetical protein
MRSICPMWKPRLEPIMVSMLATGSHHIDAERAFARAARARRRAALVRRIRRQPADRGRLPVFDELCVSLHRAVRRAGVREIPLCAIRGTLEPSRAAQFDPEFRPAGIARSRWQRVWLAEQRGATLPPISVVAVGDDYVLRDGHHRVSVARARGAVTIDALVDAG